MKILKKLSMAAGAVIILVIVAAVLTPRAAHAVAAALVQVANTATNPVLSQDVDNPARHSFQAISDSICGIFTESGCSGGLLVPSVNNSGQPVSMLVIEYVSAMGPCVDSTSGAVSLTNYTQQQLREFFNNEPGVPPPFNNVTSTSGKFYQAKVGPGLTRLYAAPNTTVVGLGGTSMNHCTVSISGYLITQ